MNSFFCQGTLWGACMTLLEAISGQPRKEWLTIHGTEISVDTLQVSSLFSLMAKNKASKIFFTHFFKRFVVQDSRYSLCTTWQQNHWNARTEFPLKPKPKALRLSNSRERIIEYFCTSFVTLFVTIIVTQGCTYNFFATRFSLNK